MRQLSKNTVDPRDHDYNNDGYVTESDWEIGKKDLNKDGKVTSAEEKKYTKQQTTTTSTTTEVDGRVTTETQTPPAEEQAANWSRDKAAAAGYSREFLKRHPAVAELLKKAIEGNWTEQEFTQAVLADTKWGQTTTESQRKFDLEYQGLNPNTIKEKVASNARWIKQLADQSGVPISEEEAQNFAYTFTRSALNEQDVYSFIAQQYGADISPTQNAANDPTEPVTGTASELADQLRALARSYGVTITEETLNQKVQEGLRQGAEWRGWVEGQRNLFRQSAKTLYPSATDKLDQYTLQEIVDPYLEDASNLLGIQRVNMDLSDPMWTRALSGETGQPMSRDEWMRTLKTDRQYGWNKTQKAQSEAASLGNEILAAFGMG